MALGQDEVNRQFQGPPPSSGHGRATTRPTASGAEDGAGGGNIRELGFVRVAHMLERGHQGRALSGGYAATEREARCIGTSWNGRWQATTTRSQS
jgi:hypothetical protein